MSKSSERPPAPDSLRRLLDAARREFATHGYQAASINRIIQAAGVHKGTLYHYVADKADLFLRVLDDYQQEIARDVSELNLQWQLEHPPEDFWGYMERASLQKLAFSVQHPEFMALFTTLYREATRPGAPARLTAYYSEASRGQLMLLLQMGQAQGAVRRDLPMEMLVDLTLAVSEIMNRSLLDDPALVTRLGLDELNRLAAPQLDMLRRMLSVPKGGTPDEP